MLLDCPYMSYKWSINIIVDLVDNAVEWLRKLEQIYEFLDAEVRVLCKVDSNSSLFFCIEIAFFKFQIRRYASLIDSDRSH